MAGPPAGRKAGRSKRTKTIDRYESIIRLHLKPAIWTVPLAKLRPIQIHDLELIKKGMDPIGVEQVHNLLTAALEHAFMMELIRRNPAALVAPPKCTRKEAFVPEVAQVRAPTSEAQQSGHHLSAIIHLAACTGLRRGELAGLTWKNSNFNASQLSVVQSLAVTEHGIKLEPYPALAILSSHFIGSTFVPGPNLRVMR